MNNTEHPFRSRRLAKWRATGVGGIFLLLLAVAMLTYAPPAEGQSATPTASQPAQSTLPVPALFGESAARNVADGGGHFLRVRSATVDFAALVAAIVPEETAIVQPIRLNLFADALYDATLTTTYPNASGSRTYIGRVDGQPSSLIVLVAHEGRLVGTVSVPGHVYTLRYARAGHTLIGEVDQRQFLPEAQPPTATFSAEELAAAARTPLLDNGLIIRVLVAFTDIARYDAGIASDSDGRAAIIAEIEAAAAAANASYLASGVVQRIQLLPPFEVTYAETNNTRTDVDRLQAGTNQLGDARTLRDIYQADLVLLVASEYDNACGEAFEVMGNETLAFESSAFAVVDRNCFSNLTFPHELGHLMGARHDWFADNTANAPFAYNHGFVFPNATTLPPPATPYPAWRTLMAYDDQCDCLDEVTPCPAAAMRATPGMPTCQRDPYWSNPNLLHPVAGVAMGISGTKADCSTNVASPDCAANNAQTLNLTRDTVANFRTNTLSDAYVDAAGSPSGNGSAASPFNTVLQGAYKANSNGNVWIRPGSYPEQVVQTITGRIVLDSEITLRVWGNGTVRIGSSGP